MPQSIQVRSFLYAVALAVAATFAIAQEVARNPKADVLKRPEVIRGQATFQANCAACHGTNAAGGMGPNLIVSPVVRHDTAGDGIGPVVHEGRMDKGMPAFPQITDAQVKDIAAFLHARIDASMRASAGGGSAFSGQLNIGNAVAGRAYFQAHCASCHNPTGDFAGIAKKYDTAELESLMLAPKAGPTMGTLTLANGESIHGTVLHQDEFSYMLRDASGNVHTASAGHGVRLAVETPLRAHDDLLKTYTNKDIHDVFAYLETLQ
jgi:cytochrome c oxidase cbb3-type subunit 3